MCSIWRTIHKHKHFSNEDNRPSFQAIMHIGRHCWHGAHGIKQQKTYN